MQDKPKRMQMDVVVMTLGLVGSGTAEARQRCDCAPASHHDGVLGTVGDWTVLCCRGKV